LGPAAKRREAAWDEAAALKTSGQARLEDHRTAWQKLSRRKVTPHILRHSHVVNALMAGVPAPMIQKTGWGTRGLLWPKLPFIGKRQF
jgi:hypothetical protein